MQSDALLLENTGKVKNMLKLYYFIGCAYCLLV